MLTQKQINEWVPETIDIFTNIMEVSDIPMPKVFIGSKVTFDKKRIEAIEYTGCETIQKTSTEETVMEYLCGEKGQAILIHQHNCPTQKIDFQCCFWHELGHHLSEYADGYSIYTKPELSETEFVENIGYKTFSEFVADAVSNYVYKQNGGKDYSDIFHWLFWLPELLKKALNYHERMVSGYFLGVYFAAILTDGSYKIFKEAVDAHKIHLGDSVITDPTSITSADAKYQEFLWMLKDCFEYQLEQKPFWKVSKPVLRTIGELIIYIVKIKNGVIDNG